MTNVCLIGNSHVANLKLALPEVQPEFPDVRTTFFVSDGLSMELEVADGQLRGREEHVRRFMALSSGTDGDIAPVYDAYVICGLTLSSLRAIRTLRATLDALRAEGRARDARVEDIAQGMDATVRKSLAYGALTKLRTLTDAPVFVIATPHAAYERHAAMWDSQLIAPRIAMLAEAFNLACTLAMEEHNATFVPQPAETVGPNALTTRPQFYRLTPDEVRAENAHHAHMNAAFGAIVLRDVLNRMVRSA